MCAMARRPAFWRIPNSAKPTCTSHPGHAVMKDDDLRIKLGRVRDRGRARRTKPFIAQALAAAEKAGGYKRRSGQRTRGSTFGRGRAASFAAARHLTDRGRRVAVKARIARHGRQRTPLRAHLEYLRREVSRGITLPAACSTPNATAPNIGPLPNAATATVITSASSCLLKTPNSCPT